MATHVSIGFSKNIDNITAADEVCQQAKTNLKQSRIDLAIIFFTSHYKPEIILPTIYKKLDQTRIIGTSTAGIILSDKIETRGISIMLITSETIKFESSFVNHLHLQDMVESGKTLAKNAFSGFGQKHRKLFLVFIDSLLSNLSNIITGMKEQIGNDLPIVGAGSIDDFHFKNSFQFDHNKFMTNSAVGVLVGGHLNVGISCQHGWRPLGKPRIIDKIDGPIIKTIDGKPAINIYKEYFDAEASTLNKHRLADINIRYPLGIYLSDDHEYLIRNVLEVKIDGSIVCQDNLPEGSEVHLMIGNKDSYLRAAQNAAYEVKKQLLEESPKIILIFESLARYKLLGKSAFQEIELIKDALGSDIPLMGMYSYGNFFSYTGENNFIQTKLQNGGISIIALS